MAGLVRSRPSACNLAGEMALMRDQAARLFPDAAIAHVGGFQGHVLGELPLQRDIPLIDARGAAAIGIADIARPMPGAALERAGSRRDTGIQGGGVQHRRDRTGSRSGIARPQSRSRWSWSPS